MSASAGASLVSCIMPTRNRRGFVGQAIWYFLRQEYPARELIVLDDGDESVADLVPKDERIHYARLENRMTVGAKRNLACEMSRGELIAHWDDDDWIGPDRLGRQVRALQEADADACGARELLYYRPRAGDAWRYRYADAGGPWLAGCTLLYRRAAWAEHPFPDLSVGEDSLFVRQLPPERLKAVDLDSCFLGLIHPDNAGNKNLADPRWERRPLDEVSRLLADDRAFYVALRSGLTGPAPRRPTPVREPITVAAQIDVTSGYGSMAEYLILGLERAGAAVHVLPLTLDAGGLLPETRALVDRSKASRQVPEGPALYFSWPRADLDRLAGASDLFVNTMWESSRLPDSWPPLLNRTRAVIVPTRFVAEVCRASGVTVPIEVIPEGIDPAVYRHEERPERAGMTTLTIGPIDDRKHVLVGIEAWKRVFADDPDARLIVKTTYGYRNYVPDDPRISYVDTREPTRGIAHWYRQADVLLALGNEGFGLPLVEGMATGLPVIALSSEGQGDVCAEARPYVLPVEPERWEPYDNGLFGRCGVRGRPAVDAVASRLRWVKTRRDEARDLGRAASAWAIEHRNVWEKAPAVLDVMERGIRPARPLRRVRTVWAPSWGKACGVAEYTADLSGSMSNVRVVAEAPDPAGLRLLHVQHEPSLVSDAELTRRVQAARAIGVPIAVTEHTIGREARAWERETDVLVSLTGRGASWLRERWPNKRVEYLPMGCPTWFPPRKQTRGRVIGAFGFLEQHKGFWRLLDVLQTVPGTELLLLGHARQPEIEARWERDAAGLPVRRERAFLPVEEVARRLAAEADLLVFWYDDLPIAAASYAARIGLATGVPVLVSSTTWFEDLGDAAFRPDDLAEGVARLLDDAPLRRTVTDAAREHCHAESWQRSAERHLALWQGLEGGR